MSRVVSDGRVTIPKRVRDFLNIEVGDYVRVTVTEVIKKKGDTVRTRGGEPKKEVARRW